jgi:hypothetical protein
VGVSGIDGSGNVGAPCLVLVNVVDGTPPTIQCPPNVLAATAFEIPAVDPGSVTVFDACGSVNVIHVSDQSDGGIDPETITRTYRAFDETGNSADCQQTILVGSSEAGPPPVVIIVEMNLGGSAVEIKSTGTNTWSVNPEFTVDPLLGNPGWSAIGSFSNAFDSGTNTTVFELPATNPPPLQFRVRQSFP